MSERLFRVYIRSGIVICGCVDCLDSIEDVMMRVVLVLLIRVWCFVFRYLG